MHFCDCKRKIKSLLWFSCCMIMLEKISFPIAYLINHILTILHVHNISPCMKNGFLAMIVSRLSYFADSVYMHKIFYLDGHNVVKVHIMHIFFDVVSGNRELQILNKWWNFPSMVFVLPSFLMKQSALE